MPLFCSPQFKISEDKNGFLASNPGGQEPPFVFGIHWTSEKNSSCGCCQAMVDREAALRQLTWALRLILAGETASVNSGRDQVISSCVDECLASHGPCPREDYPLYILRIDIAPYTHTNTHILWLKWSLLDKKENEHRESKSVRTWNKLLTAKGVKPCLGHDIGGVMSPPASSSLHLSFFKQTGKLSLPASTLLSSI